MQVHPLGNDSYVIGEHVEVGRGVTVGPGTIIRATTCRIGDDVRLGASNRFLVGDALTVGARTVMNDRNDLSGRRIEIGEDNYWESNIEVGQGGRFGPNARFRIGPRSMVCDRVILNLSDAVEIGADVGIGNEVNVWTHGSFLPILEGFPADFGPVRIGDKVWLPARSVVLPGRTIGRDVVIGMGSLINKDIPDGAFAAGWPVRILERGRYPRRDPAAAAAHVRAILADYAALAAYKGLRPDVTFDEAAGAIRCNGAVFDLRRMEVEGTLGQEGEDLRDYLRRRGIKFYTGRPFQPTLPAAYRRLLEVEVG